MKILHTVHRYHPFTGGSEEVVRQLSERLVRFGHEVTVATTAAPGRDSKLINGVKIEEFHCSGDMVEGIKGEADRYRSFLRNGEFDIIMNYGAQIWCSDLMFDLLPELKAKKICIPLGFYRLPDARYAGYFKTMPEVLRKYDAVVYLSSLSPDKEFAARHEITNGIIIPNGTEVTDFEQAPKGEFRRKHNLENAFIVLNVSNHSGVKNHSLFWKCVNQLKGEDITFVLIGNALTSSMKKWLKECYTLCRMKGLYFNALVLEHTPRHEVIQAFVDADVFLFTSVFECSPLVMFEAFASKTLFVSTDCGNVKDFLDCVCIVKDEQEAKRMITDYKNHPATYAGKIARGFEFVSQKLNWETIARQYEELYSSLLRKKVNW
ncbi:MAG: glycosyltransferase [Bacteroidetes bacterium]|nr:MAG: glycosyltransferase [Bacteroidota bacterium]